jgi:hypothetical protein
VDRINGSCAEQNLRLNIGGTGARRGLREVSMRRRLMPGFVLVVMMPASAAYAQSASAYLPPLSVPEAFVRQNGAYEVPRFQEQPRRSTGSLLGAGILAAVGGAVVGGVAGYAIGNTGHHERSPFVGAAIGWMAVPAVVTPIVVNVRNHGHGSVLASFALAGGIVAVPLMLESAHLALVAPLLQAGSAVAVHRSTDRRQ